MKLSLFDFLILYVVSSLFFAEATAVSNKGGPKTFGKNIKERYDNGEPWTTSMDGTEFQPASNKLSPLAQEHLRRLTTASDSNSLTDESPYNKLFADGAETYYDEYAQAWRALGFYIDCDYCYNGYTGRGLPCITSYNATAGGDVKKATGCRRFLLWAAYVDEGYSGNGVGEYKYYDRKSNTWDDSACEYENSTRCVEMDCHLKGSHFTLLGFFREPNYDEWLEQLFKHQGDCLWDDNEYLSMQGDREAWPEGCAETIFQIEGSSETIHYAIKPLPYGSMGIGLYTDSACIVDYSGSLTADEVLRTMVCGGYIQNYDEDTNGNDDYGAQISEWMCDSNNTDYLHWYQQYYNDNDDQDMGPDDGAKNNVWSLNEYLDDWNAAFDVYKQCQPCKAYDLTHNVAGIGYVKNATGTRYRKEDHDLENMDDDYAISQYLKNDTFHCHDDAGYNNVNQCMKFRSKTQMLTASWRDVETAAMQGTITRLQIPAKAGGSSSFQTGKGILQRTNDYLAEAGAWIFLIVSVVLFGGNIYRYISIRNELLEEEKDSRVGLLASKRQPSLEEEYPHPLSCTLHYRIGRSGAGKKLSSPRKRISRWARLIHLTRRNRRRRDVEVEESRID